MQHSTTRQAKQKISANLDHHRSKKCSFLCVQTNWIFSSGTQRFCKNDSDSSLEPLTVTRVSQVILWKTWLESSHHFCQRYSSRVRVTKNRDSSRVASLTRVTLSLSKRSVRVYTVAATWFCHIQNTVENTLIKKWLKQEQLSLLVNDNAAECNVSQEKTKLWRKHPRWHYRHKRNHLG